MQPPWFHHLAGWTKEGIALLDVRLPGLSGLELQRELADRAIPVIFITGHGDIPMSVEAMKAGAVEFLTKLFRDQVLLDAIRRRSSATAQIESARLRLPNCMHGMTC